MKKFDPNDFCIDDVFAAIMKSAKAIKTKDSIKKSKPKAKKSKAEPVVRNKVSDTPVTVTFA